MSRHSKPKPTTSRELFADQPRLMTIAQVAQELQFSTRHVRRLIASGELQSTKLCPAVRGAVRVHRDSLAAFIERAAA